MCGCGKDHAGNAEALKKRQTRNFSDPWRKTPGRVLGTSLIRLYQLTLSSFIGNSCRHMPTCSEYTYESVARYGLWNGSWMGLFRIMRCGPMGTHGFDPVPRELSNHYRWYLPWRYWRVSSPKN
ncbi:MULTISPECIES: membrane protein insertion efficiency factor YidD [unclassified Ochrobactrum]|uniref:membrane protein insertion efficiency factor YidD n=1 Tax=unclassified Ochrobactrum TaxID=239106 RepID=UPI0030AC2C82